MAEETKKPRNVKDLKARLGRTISPATAPGGGGPVPPPAIGGPGAPAGVTPPPIGRPAAGVPSPFGPPPPAAPTSRDPFAAASQPPPAQQEYRLVIDDKPVTDEEVGRKQRGRTLAIVAVFAVLALGLGYGAGSIMSRRHTYNSAVNDGKDVYQAVRKAADVMNEAKRHVDSAVEAARGTGGKTPAVAYEAIEQLRALENPFTAGQFSRKNYVLFNQATVDQLFDYFNNLNVLFERFESLAATTLPEAKRTELDAAAEAAGTMATRQTGCVPDVVEGRFMCGLVYVQFAEVAEGEQASAKVRVSTSPGAATAFEKEIYTGQDLTDGTAADYVVLVNTQRSVGVLGQQATAFAEYNRKLLEINQLMQQTLEIQGNLERQLGEIAALSPVFAF